MKCRILCLSLLVSAAVAKDVPVWQKTERLIPDYQQQLKKFNEAGFCPLVLPALLLQPKSDRYYLHLERNALGGVAYIDYTKDCKGAHYCSAGRVSVKHQTKSALPNGQRIKLADGTKASYRGAAVGADYHNPQLVWLKARCLYTLSWDASKASLLTMVNARQRS